MFGTRKLIEVLKRTSRHTKQMVKRKTNNERLETKYTKMKGDKSVMCHKQNYAYTVFYCHATKTTKAYMVTLEAADGSKAKAVDVYHTDISAWNPEHLAFQVLKVKLGTVPVCHFLLL
ncbi:BURP domain-containing protein [Euphorbia peplus]|nr:BURP domain-containing protein [Euphorbia peplus]